MLRVAVASVDRAEGARPEPPRWMGESERMRWTALAASRRAAFVTSRALARRLLKGASGLAHPDWDISAEAGAAPIAHLAASADRSVPTPPCLSLSHRLDWVAVAVATSGLGPIGVDIECQCPPRSDPVERAALMLSADERISWSQLDPAEREGGLLTRWSAKEAWYKAAPATGKTWDFRRVVSRVCDPSGANVRVWRGGAVVLALCCDNSPALADAICEGLPSDEPRGDSFWHVCRLV